MEPNLLVFFSVKLQACTTYGLNCYLGFPVEIFFYSYSNFFHASELIFSFKESVHQLYNPFEGNAEAAKILSDWGLTLDSKPLSLDGRTLPPEVIVFGSKEVRSSETADFSREATRERVLVPVSDELGSCACAGHGIISTALNKVSTFKWNLKQLKWNSYFKWNVYNYTCLWNLLLEWNLFLKWNLLLEWNLYLKWNLYFKWN